MRNKEINTKAILLIIPLAISFILAGGKNDKNLGSPQSNDTTKLEKYERKVIIDAKWGSGPGEFGVLKEGVGSAPNCFTLDRNGNLYIADGLNGRIQKFSANGCFLKAIEYTQFSDKTFYSDLKLGPIDVVVANDNSLWLLCYVRSETLAGNKFEVRRHSNDGVFMLSLTVPQELFLPNKAEITHGLSPHVIKPRVNRITVENEKVVVEGIFEGDNFEAREAERRKYTMYSGQHVLSKKEILLSKEVISIESVDFAYRGWLEHKDAKEEMFYFSTFEVIGEKNGWEERQGLVLKYDKNGKLLAKIEYPLHTWGTVKHLYFDDKTESIYCLTNDDDGMQLLVYTKSPLKEGR